MSEHGGEYVPLPLSPERAGVLMADAAYRQVCHERDLLAKALGDLLAALGGVEVQSMTGPQLLLFAEEATRLALLEEPDE